MGSFPDEIDFEVMWQTSDMPSVLNRGVCFDFQVKYKSKLDTNEQKQPQNKGTL